MDPIDKFLKLYSYKFPKGHIDINDPQDILLLENILKEEFDIVLESATDDTETLHEIFTAMFVAGHKPIQFTDIREVDWDKVDLGSKLRKTDKHRNEIKKYINNNTKNDKARKYKSLYDDAKKISDSIASNLGYSGPIEAERVFADGKKEKADITIYQPNRRDTGLGVSLKYGTGQFNSLSPNTVLKNLYKLDKLQAPTEEKPKTPGILSQITKDDKEATDSIDMGAKAYVNFVLDQYQDIKGDNLKTQQYLNDPQGRDFKAILDKIKTSGMIPIKKKGDIPIEDITWDLWRKAENNVQKAFSKAYNAQPLSRTAKTDFLPTKAKSINTVVQKFIEDNAGVKLNGKIEGTSDNGEQIRKFLEIILGSGDESYYYIGDGGKKFTFIPSKERLKSLDYYIKTEYDETDSDFIIDLIVYGKDKKGGEWTELFSTDVKLRFAGDGGQFTSDITQKGSNFKLGKNNEEININKLFGFK